MPKKNRFKLDRWRSGRGPVMISDSGEFWVDPPPYLDIHGEFKSLGARRKYAQEICTLLNIATKKLKE